MHRCSESVGSIATALAKAQTELTNPEKSMVGTIYHTNRGDNPQTFRYAPLSGGLEIVRKILGGQQIAVAQTTDVDRVNGLISLTTVLMHTSGEWISSDWPVCALSETSAPRRMGAALTYARRYALFTLVGIAGEDDLDAPDLQDDRPGSAQQQIPPSSKADPLPETYARPAQYRPSKPGAILIKEILSAHESNLIRLQLQVEIDAFTTADHLQDRAIEILKAKNRLSAADARLIEIAFTAKMAVLQKQAEQDAALPDTPTTSVVEASLNSQSGVVHSIEPSPSPKRRGRAPKKPKSEKAGTPPDSDAEVSVPPAIDKAIGGKIDKSQLTIPETRRRRDKAHLRYVATQPCLICDRSPSDPHHLRFAQPRAMGRKSSDEFVVPLCRAHHRDNHRHGDERAWWERTSLNPLEVSLRLWKLTREGIP